MTADETAGGGERPAPGLGSRALALVCLAPSVLQAIGRPDGAWLVALGLAAPWVVDGVSRRSGRAPAWARSAGRVLAAALALGFATSVLPTVLGLFGFRYERVFLGGALAWLAWRGLLVPRPTVSRWPGRLRAVILAWGAWSVGSTVHAVVAGFPPGFPWLGEALRATLTDPLGFRSMVDPLYPLDRLAVRLETLLVAWAALEVALDDARLPRRLARAFALVLPAGVLVNLLAAALGTRGSLQPLGIRVSSTFDRVFRPLPDHNALGSALVVMLLPAAWVAWRAWPESASLRIRAGWATCVLCGLGLLFASTSKSAFLGLAVAGGAGLLLWMAFATGRARTLLVRVAIALVLVPILVQALPRATFDELMETRYARDLVRAARLDFVTDYLRENRYALWRSAGAMMAEEPLAGVGLGRFPRRLADFHDPKAGSHFNPVQENAHNQYLQWAAEDGVVGAALGIALALLGVLCGVRATRAPPPEDAAGGATAGRLLWCALTASLVGLGFNLLVGHALFVPAVAGLYAGVVGLLVAAADRSATVPRPAVTARRPAVGRLALAGLVLAPLGAVPAFVTERTPLEEHQLGCFPWLWQPGTRGAPPVSRMLAPDARWMQRWGEGSRMVMFAKTIVAEHLTDDVQHLDVLVDGERVVEGFRLPLKDPREPVNPVVVLKVDAPAGVAPGDLVEVRVLCDRPYAESMAGGHSQALWGPRVWPASFRDPR